MTLFLLLVALAVVGGVAAVATGRVRGGLDEPTTSRPYRPLPDARLTPDDVDDVRFPLGVRGYRMDDVDSVLRRLADELAERDAEIARLRRALADPAAAAPARDGQDDQQDATR
ncbi:DivIVA domain-containing protein [Thalassiella azotivora]